MPKGINARREAGLLYKRPSKKGKKGPTVPRPAWEAGKDERPLQSGIARACHLEDKGDMFSCHWKTGAGQNAANGSENVGHVPPLKARGVPVHAGIGG